MGYFQLDLDGDRRRCAHFSSSWQNVKFATTTKKLCSTKTFITLIAIMLLRFCAKRKKGASSSQIKIP